jgi:hypothetical protein
VNKTFRKGIVIFFLTAFTGGLLTIMYLDEHFYRTAPRKPDPQSGRVCMRNIHGGAQVYLTRREALPFDYFELLSIPFFAALFLEWRWKTFRNTYDEMPKKFY